MEQDYQEGKDKHGLRVSFSWWIFGLVVVWLALVASSVFLSGWKIGGFVLSDKVLITFITSTTVDVLGLFVLVAKWMYPHDVLTPKRLGKRL